LAAAGAVGQAHPPAVPGTDHLALLHHAFAERKAKMGAEVFEGEDPAFPAKHRDVQPVGPHGVAEPVHGQLRKARHPYPFTHRGNPRTSTFSAPSNARMRSLTASGIGILELRA